MCRSIPQEALRAWFLGPRGENAELLERLVVEALRDHVFWRRNYHPEDGFTIREMDKRQEGYESSVAVLTQELLGLLAELKRDVPFFSGRYKGHMIAEQTIASQIGYFATMLYNPNNIAAEISPVTTRLEMEVARDLARMIGYDPSRSWGHLTSGGTVANFEALWLARSVRYLPVAVAGAAAELGLELEVGLPDGSKAPLTELRLWDLLNIPDEASLDLWERLLRSAGVAAARRALANHSLADDRLSGVQPPAGAGLRRPAAGRRRPGCRHRPLLLGEDCPGAGHRLQSAGLRSPRLLLSNGPDALWERVSELVRHRQPILACVSVCGTTEESAVDRLDRVIEVRDRAARELGASFHIHSDACYGGYAAAVTRKADGTRRTGAEIRRSTGELVA